MVGMQRLKSYWKTARTALIDISTEIENGEVTFILLWNLSSFF